MLTLTEFLLARIAEDEAVARAARSLVPWLHIANAAASHDQREAGLHVLDWSPSRVLADCEAKRRIVEYGERAALEPEGSHFIGYRAAISDALRALALPYAEHPDFRAEWKP